MLNMKEMLDRLGNESVWMVIRYDEKIWISELNNLSVGDLGWCIDLPLDFFVRHKINPKKYDLLKVKYFPKEQGWTFEVVNLRKAQRKTLLRLRMALDILEGKIDGRNKVTDGNVRRMDGTHNS